MLVFKAVAVRKIVEIARSASPRAPESPFPTVDVFPSNKGKRL